MVVLTDQLRGSILGTSTTKCDKGFGFPRGHIQRQAEHSEEVGVRTYVYPDSIEEISR